MGYYLASISVIALLPFLSPLRPIKYDFYTSFIRRLTDFNCLAYVLSINTTSASSWSTVKIHLCRGEFLDDFLVEDCEHFELSASNRRLLTFANAFGDKINQWEVNSNWQILVDMLVM